MKLYLQEDKTIKEAIVEITYSILDRNIRKVIDMIEKNVIHLEAKKGTQFYTLETQDIYYIESVDNATFIYQKEEVFESNEKLYALEEKLQHTSFIRINKSTIVNMDNLVSVRPLQNYRLEARLKNEEKIIISRHYMKQVKQYLNI